MDHRLMDHRLMDHRLMERRLIAQPFAFATGARGPQTRRGDRARAPRLAHCLMLSEFPARTAPSRPPDVENLFGRRPAKAPFLRRTDRPAQRSWAAKIVGADVSDNAILRIPLMARLAPPRLQRHPSATAARRS